MIIGLQHDVAQCCQFSCLRIYFKSPFLPWSSHGQCNVILPIQVMYHISGISVFFFFLRPYFILFISAIFNLVNPPRSSDWFIWFTEKIHGSLSCQACVPINSLELPLRPVFIGGWLMGWLMTTGGFPWISRWLKLWEWGIPTKKTKKHSNGERMMRHHQIEA